MVASQRSEQCKVVVVTATQDFVVIDFRRVVWLEVWDGNFLMV